MGLFEKIKNTIEPSELKRKKSHLKNLYKIAIADGKLENLEFDFLLAIAEKNYLKPEVVQNVIHFPEDISFYVPEHNAEKIDQMYECVCMALIDGNLNDKEIGTCKIICTKLGYRPIVVDKIIEQIITGITDNIKKQMILNNLLNKF